MKTIRKNDVKDFCMYCCKTDRCQLFKKTTKLIVDAEKQGVLISLLTRKCKFFEKDDDVEVIGL